MGFDDLCNTHLVLGLGLSMESYDTSKKPSNHHHQNFDKLLAVDRHHQPSLTLSLFGGDNHHQPPVVKGFDSDAKNSTKNRNFYDQISSGDVISAGSSLSNGSVKREREVGSEEVEIERVNSSRASDEDDDDGSNGRKKLRLNKAQSALLEESFMQHSTLNPNQKQELARKLNLRPRQVEVWFQNRRARTKLKQTEVDCEFLKKCCETLTEENRRLQKEVQELKAFKLAQPLYMQLPAATLTMCPSCERIGGGGVAVSDGGAAKGGGPFAMAAAKTHFYQPFTKSAAC